MAQTKEYPLPNERKWLKVGMERPKHGLNPNLPPQVIVAVVAYRSDGIWFRVEGALMVDKVKLLPNAVDGANIGMNLIGDLMVKLETYRNCECLDGKPCKDHGGGRPN